LTIDDGAVSGEWCCCDGAVAARVDLGWCVDAYPQVRSATTKGEEEAIVKDPKSAGADPARNRRFVIDHFEDFVNRRDLGAVDRNMSAKFVDHDLAHSWRLMPSNPISTSSSISTGKPTDRDGNREMMAALHKNFPDLRVEVRDSIAEGDLVAVRNVWSYTDAKTGKRMEFHGFVLWRIADGKLVERWATITPAQELNATTLEW
jgi:predicted ester cyclase